MSINWLALLSSATWVELIVMFIYRFIYPMTTSLGIWYTTYGMTAVTCDVLVLVLGVSLAKFLFPTSNLIMSSVAVQLIHDVLFYVGVIKTVPLGQNSVMDLFKRYASEGGFGILAADSAMIASAVVGMDYLSTLPTDYMIFLGLLAVYSLTYLIYTK